MRPNPLLVGQAGTLLQALISPDGTWLTTVYGRRVRVYDARTGDEGPRFRLSAHCDCVRYSPDGTRIATLGNDGIRVLDAASGQLQATLQNVAANTNQMQFGGCSHVLVTAASNDSVIRVWDVASGTLTGLCDTAPGTADPADTRWLTLGDGSGRVALTSCTDGTLRVWDVTTGQERTSCRPLRGSGSAPSTATRPSWPPAAQTQSPLRSGQSREGPGSSLRRMLSHQTTGAAIAAADGPPTSRRRTRQVARASHLRGGRAVVPMPLTVTPNATRPHMPRSAHPHECA
jgi:WD40 repeat protein